MRAGYATSLLVALTGLAAVVSESVHAQGTREEYDFREIHPDVVRAKTLVNRTWGYIAQAIGPPKSASMDDMLKWRAKYYASIWETKLLCPRKREYLVDGRIAIVHPVFYNVTPYAPRELIWGVMMTWSDPTNTVRDAGVRFVWRVVYEEGKLPTKSFHAEYRNLRRHESDPTRIVQLLHPDGMWRYDATQQYAELDYRRFAPRWHQALAKLVRMQRSDLIGTCRKTPKDELDRRDLRSPHKRDASFPQ